MPRFAFARPALIAIAAATAAIMILALSSRLARAQEEKATKPIEPQEKIMLFNGKDFTGWKLFVPDANFDVAKLWSIKDGVIRCEGKPSGYFRTEADYANYKLRVEYRWEPVADESKARRNTGLLVHMSLPDKVWPKSIECQGMQNNAGDFFMIDGTECKEHEEIVAKEAAKQAQAAAPQEGKPGKGGKKAAPKGPTRRVPKLQPSSEKPVGEWNIYEVICKGDTVTPIVNDVVQNRATAASVTSGKIALQSEGGVIEFRNIYLEPADAR